MSSFGVGSVAAHTGWCIEDLQCVICAHLCPSVYQQGSFLLSSWTVELMESIYCLRFLTGNASGGWLQTLTSQASEVRPHREAQRSSLIGRDQLVSIILVFLSLATRGSLVPRVYEYVRSRDESELNFPMGVSLLIS